MTDPLGETDVAPRWRDAFRSVDRAWFVPEFFVPNPDRAGWLRVSAPSARWRTAVRSDDALITQVGGSRDGARGLATSSTSAPSLMATMLENLDIQDGHRVLEIGTGTGYNTALLSHRLGDRKVTSIDVDPTLVALARRRLAENGFHPSVHVGDAVHGYPVRNRYDRIIATVALPDVPTSWWDQLADDGKVLLPLDRHGTGGLLASFRRRGQALDGRLLGSRGYFMPLRAHTFDPATVLSAASPPTAGTRTTDLPVEEITTPGGPAEHVVALLTGGFDRIDFTPDDTGIPQVWLTRPDGSWARLVPDGSGTTLVSQGGSHRIWDAVERAHRRWAELGRPGREAVVLHVSASGSWAAVRDAAGRLVPLSVGHLG